MSEGLEKAKEKRTLRISGSWDMVSGPSSTCVMLFSAG